MQLNMNLKTQRFLKGLSQYDIAFKTGIQQPKISLIERGYLDAKESEKKKIAKALGHSVEDIFPKEGVS